MERNTAGTIPKPIEKSSKQRYKYMTVHFPSLVQTPKKWRG